MLVDFFFALQSYDIIVNKKRKSFFFPLEENLFSIPQINSVL